MEKTGNEFMSEDTSLHGYFHNVACSDCLIPVSNGVDANWKTCKYSKSALSGFFLTELIDSWESEELVESKSRTELSQAARGEENLLRYLSQYHPVSPSDCQYTSIMQDIILYL